MKAKGGGQAVPQPAWLTHRKPYDRWRWGGGGKGRSGRQVELLAYSAAPEIAWMTCHQYHDRGRQGEGWGIIAGDDPLTAAPSEWE